MASTPVQVSIRLLWMNYVKYKKSIGDLFSPATSGRSWTAGGVVSTRAGCLKLPRRRWSLPSSMDWGDLHCSSKPAPHLTSITHSYIVVAAVLYYWFFFSVHIIFCWVLWFFFVVTNVVYVCVLCCFLVHSCSAEPAKFFYDIIIIYTSCETND